MDLDGGLARLHCSLYDFSKDRIEVFIRLFDFLDYASLIAVFVLRRTDGRESIGFVGTYIKEQSNTSALCTTR